MIPLSKSKKLKEKYNQWYQENKDTLYEHFEKEKGPWIKAKNLSVIQGLLFPTSNYKCAYCEREINLGGGLEEIEHFYAKKENPEKTFDFDNLLLACKQCNTSKNTKKVEEDGSTWKALVEMES